MDRKEFLQGCCAMVFLTSLTGNAETSESPNDANLKFIQNWVSDLMETLDSDFPEEQKIKLMDGCGRGCYRRFTWKQDIAAKGKGSPEKLIEALKANFEVWREGNLGAHSLWRGKQLRMLLPRGKVSSRQVERHSLLLHASDASGDLGSRARQEAADRHPAVGTPRRSYVSLLSTPCVTDRGAGPLLL